MPLRGRPLRGRFREGTSERQLLPAVVLRNVVRVDVEGGHERRVTEPLRDLHIVLPRAETHFRQCVAEVESRECVSPTAKGWLEVMVSDVAAVDRNGPLVPLGQGGPNAGSCRVKGRIAAICGPVSLPHLRINDRRALWSDCVRPSGNVFPSRTGQETAARPGRSPPPTRRVDSRASDADSADRPEPANTGGSD